MGHTSVVPNKRRKMIWTVMQTSASNAPSRTALTTAKMRTTAPWTRSWWVPTRQILPWTSAPTASPSARDNMKKIAAACAAAISFSSWRKSRIPIWYQLEKLGFPEKFFSLCSEILLAGYIVFSYFVCILIEKQRGGNPMENYENNVWETIEISVSSNQSTGAPDTAK